MQTSQENTSGHVIEVTDTRSSVLIQKLRLMPDRFSCKFHQIFRPFFFLRPWQFWLGSPDPSKLIDGNKSFATYIMISMSTKFYIKLTFVISSYPHARMRIRGYEMLVFRKIFGTYQMESLNTADILIKTQGKNLLGKL